MFVLSVDPEGMSTGLSRGAPFLIWLTMNWIMPVLAPIAVFFQPNGSLPTLSKSAADMLRASFDEKTLGEHPQALYLNGSEIGEVTPEAKDEMKQRELWKGSIPYAGIREGVLC